MLKLGLDPIKVRAFTEGSNDTANNPTPPTPGNLLTTGLDMVKLPGAPLVELATKAGSWIGGRYLDKLLHPDPQPTPGTDFGDPNAPKPTGGGTGQSADASASSASGSSAASAGGAADPTALAAVGGSESSGADSTASLYGGAQGTQPPVPPTDATAFDATGAPSLAANDPATDDGSLTDQDVAELTPNFAPDQLVMNGLDQDVA